MIIGSRGFAAAQWGKPMAFRGYFFLEGGCASGFGA
jgi:hypothetical protein